MKFLINDKLTKEIYGIFNSKEEAEIFYIKNNVTEKLKYYCNRIVNQSELMEDIALVRKFESLLNEIYDYNPEEHKNFNFSYFMTIADELLYKYCKDDELHKKLSVLNYELLRFDDDIKRFSL